MAHVWMTTPWRFETCAHCGLVREPEHEDRPCNPTRERLASADLHANITFIRRRMAEKQSR